VFRKTAWALIIALLLPGCDLIKSYFEGKEETQFAKHYVALFQARDFDAIEATIDPKLKDGNLRATLQQMADFFPKETPKSIVTVGLNTFSYENLTRTNLTIQYEFSQNWLLANVSLERSGDGPFVVAGVHVQPVSDSVQNINRFTIRNKPAIDYVLLAIAILNTLFVFASLILCIRTPIPKSKWLWIVFVLVGVVQFSVNWTTGEFTFTPISFQLFGAGLTRSGFYGPWVLAVSVPIGAIVFLTKRKKWLRAGIPSSPI
jgi:hypothetical protein